MLWSLVDGPDERDLSDLTEVVARRESASEEDSDVDTHVVAIRLYHVHLPKLDDAGFVSFDTGTNVVSLTAPESEVKFRLGQRVGLDS